MKYFVFPIILVSLFISISFMAGAVTCPDTTNFKVVDGVCIPSKTGLAESTVQEVVTNLLEWLLGIFGFLGIIAFVIAGIFYLTAAGDPEQEKKAKNAMKMGILGVIVGLSGFVLIQAIDAALNAGNAF